MRHPGFARAIARRPSRGTEWGWMIVVLLTCVAGLLLLAGPFLRPDRFGLVSTITFVLMGAALLRVSALGWRVQRRRLGAVTAAPAIVIGLQPIKIDGEYPRTEQLVELRLPDGVRELRDRHNRPLRLGAAGVAHTADDILLAFTPLEP